MKKKPFFRILISAGFVTILSQAGALLRQILIVSSYGLGRDLDFYTTLFAIMSTSVFMIAFILENNFIGLLSKLRIKEGDDAVRSSFLNYFGASILCSFVVVAFLTLLFPIVSMPFTAGFSGEDRIKLTQSGLYFLPWALLILPFAALGACLKSIRHYQAVFIAELVVVLVSTAVIYYQHETVGDIALAFAIAYAIAILFLLLIMVQQVHFDSQSHFPWRQFTSRFLRHFGTNQLGILATMAERFWVSYLPAGNIAALGVVQQLTTSLNGLIGFRDAYVVPLADENGRDVKLARLLIGMCLLTTAVATFIAIAALPLSTMLYQYGKTSGDAVALIALLLQISMVSVIAAAIGTPVWRVQQVGAHYRPMAIIYAISAILIFILGAILIGWFQMDAAGMAIVTGINSVVGCLVALYFARKMGVRVTSMQWQLLARFCLFIVVAGMSAFYILNQVSASVIVCPMVGGMTYGMILGVYVLLHCKQLRLLVYGDANR